jgi:cytoskeletal protein RodZ
MKSKLKVIAYLCALTLIIILIFIFTNQKNQQTFKIDSPEIDVKSEQNPTSPPNQKSSSDSTQQQTLTPPQQPVSSNNDIAKDPYNAETKNSINNEQFKEINENMKKRNL